MYLIYVDESGPGLRVNPIDRQGIEKIEPLIYRGNEALQDTLQWLVEQQKKERPGDEPGSA